MESSFKQLRQDKPKLLYIVEAMGGGVFSYIVDLSSKLVDSFDLYIAYAIRQQTPSDYKKYFDMRVHLIEVQNFTRSVNVKKDFKAFFEIKRIAKEINPDIIHLHSSKAGVLGRWTFNGRKLPIFYTPHGYSFLMGDCGKIKRIVYRFIEKLSAKRYCTTISCSEGEHKETLKLTKCAVYVDNGINIESLQKLIDSVGKSKEHPFTVYTLGRICYQKNPAQFNKIAEKMPGVRFLWIGDGELKHQLVAPNIIITGWVKRIEALKLAQSADVFILTSLWEGLPISLLESMYMKKLCIVSNVIGNHDVIQNDINGYVCDSVEQFVNAIERYEEAEKLVECAYASIQTHYNTSIMANQYRNIYDSALRKMAHNIEAKCKTQISKS